MKKRLLSILLVLCMVLTLVPTTALAATDTKTPTGSNVSFTISGDTYLCGRKGHTGTVEQLLLTDVDISAWDTDHKITVAYELTYSCSETSCPQHPGDGAEQRKIGTYTFTDVDLCHKKVNETIKIQHLAANDADDSVTLQLTSDTSLSQVVFHALSTPYAICTESYYTTNCWECTGCDSFFLNADCTGNKFERDQMEFPAAGHRMQYIDAKGPTCVDRGTVAHWQCERCKVTFSDQQGEHELTKLETDAPLVPHQYDNDGTCTVCSGKAAAGVRAGGSTAWYDTLDAALTALDADDATELVINRDCAAFTVPGKTCTVQVKEGATVDRVDIADTDGSQITVINHGTVKELYGYTGRVTLQSGSGTYGLIVNSSASGSAGSFLYRESAAKFCCYKITNGTWLRPDEVTESTVRNAAVVYAPLASLTITGAGITGSGDAYALAARQGTPVTLTAAAVSLSGFSSENVTYRWYYEDEPATLLSEAAELVLENSKAGKRTIICTAAADGYTVSVRLTATVDGVKDPQTFTVKLSKTNVGIGEKLLPFLSVEGLRENASVTYYQMLGAAPDPTKDTVIDGDFAFTATGAYQIYAYAGETDNYAATASTPITLDVMEHAEHCYCGGSMNHTHETVTEWQAWDGQSEIQYTWTMVPISSTGKVGRAVAYVYLTGDVKTNLTVSAKQILYLCLNGHSFTSADPSQPAITVQGAEKREPAALKLCDCVGTGTLGGCTSGEKGGSIYAKYANIELYSGTLTGNSVSGNGGAVFIQDDCSFTMYGGTITGNTATGSGGGIYAYGAWNTCTVTINGGVISHNQANCGGGIYAANRTQFQLNGGEITGNTAIEDGGGVYCHYLYSQNTGRCEFYGGTISGNTAKRGGGAYAGLSYVGYRNCRISGNTAAEAGGGFYLVPRADENAIYMGAVYGGSSDITPYIYDNTVNAAQNNLYLSDADTQIKFTARINTGGNAKIGVYFTGITSKGASVLLNYLPVNQPHVAETYLSRISCDNPDFSRLEARKDGSNYNLYLICTGQESTVTFNPTGGTLNAGETTKTVNQYGSYGELPTPDRANYHFDGWFTAPTGGTEVKADTTVTTAADHTLYAHWSEVECTVTFDPNGGTLTGSSTKTVTYNGAYGELPVPTRAGYDFDGWYTEAAGGSKVEADTVVTVAADHTLYAHWTTHEHCICGGSVNAGDHTGHTSVGYTAWDGRSAITYTNKTAYVYLTDSVTFSSNLVVDGTTLYLCLHGKTYASNGTSKIQVKNGGRLVLCDCAGGGTIKGAAKGWGGSCFYLYQSTLDIFGGTITGGKVTGKGGGGAIALDDSKCVLNIYGGAISNNNGYFTGGAIFLNSKDKTGGTVRMYGGTISGNTAKKGGVIFSSCGGTILLAGGTISGNTATDGDGGVINMAGGTITLSGAKLIGNTASQYGGAVYLYNGVTASMTGGEISGNQAASEGGAVHVYGTSTFNLSGGKITGNSSVDGGAIYLNREPSVLNMTDGVISGNTATGNGGGVYIFRTRSICNLSGGTIESNTAGGNGGGIYVNPKNSGQLKLSGAPTVRNNTVSGAANNVYLPTGKTLTVSGSMAKGALIGVTTQNTGYPVAFSGVYGTNYEDCFSADDAAAHVEYRDDQMLYLVSGAPMQKFTITVEVPGGHGTASASRITAVAGTQITLTATPDDGYHLKNWGSDPAVTFTGSTFDMPASNVTVSAYFEAHSFTAETAGEQYLKSAATCTESAVYYKSCTGCGLSSKDTADEDTFVYGDPEGHTWSDWASNDNGTHTRRCTVPGCTASETDNCAGMDDGDCTTAVTCDVCGYVITAAKAEHTWGGWASNDDGTHTRRCTVPGCTASETESCTGMDDGDCTTAVKCGVCGYVITAAKADHTWGGWASNNDGTHTRRCTVSGCTASETDNCAGTDDGDCTTAVKCGVCGYVITAAKAEHTWGGWASNDNGTHTRGCTLSGCTASEMDNCTGTDDGDCTTALNCEVCGYVITAAKAEHTWDGWASNDDGTHTRRCTVPGCTASETDNCAGMDDGDCTTALNCEVCGYVITAAKAEHTWGGWASNNDGTHTRRCTVPGCTASETDNCAGTDDGDCTTAVKCGVCGYVITAAKAEHTWGGWASNDNGTHTRGCTLSGCTASEMDNCTGTDDGDCTTALNCEVCGYVITAAKAEHTWDGWASNDDGTHTRRCTVPGCTASETDNCAGMDDGDCTTALNCEVCGYVITAAKAEHTWGDWASNDDGTHTRGCTVSGCTASETESCAGTDDGDCTTAVKCGVCGYVITAAKAEHTWGGWTSNDDGTHTRRCTVSGCTASETDNCTGTDDGDCTTALNCEVCGYIITAAKAEHTWGGWASNDDGTHTRGCTLSGCTASETESCAGTDDGDCTTAVKCGVCGYVITAAKAEHTWGGWTSNDDGTHTRRCTVSGCTASETDNCTGTDDGDCTTALNCEVCGYIITAAKAEHTWGGWASNDDGTHTRGCTLSGCTASQTDNCAGGTADCVNKAVCTTCGGQYGEIDPAHHAAGCKPTWTTTKTDHEQKYSLCGKVTVAKAAHSFGEWRITQAPTTSQSGERARTCGICGYQETAVIPASGSGSSTSDSYYTIKATAGDNGSISPSGDVSVREGGDQTFTITPKQGYAVSDVKVDGKSIGAVKSYTFKNVSTSHTIEVTFAKAVGTPQTGDSSQMPLWLVLLSVSASGLTGTVLYSRRKRSK